MADVLPEGQSDRLFRLVVALRHCPTDRVVMLVAQNTPAEPGWKAGWGLEVFHYKRLAKMLPDRCPAS
jgi:hypothetical protein